MWCPLCPTNSLHQPHNCPIHTATIVPVSDDIVRAEIVDKGWTGRPIRDDEKPMSDDIVDHLRRGAELWRTRSVLLGAADMTAAADEIIRLRAEVGRLIPFARLIATAEPYKTIPMEPDDVLWDRVHPTVREAADARAALAAYEAAHKEATS